MFRSARERVVAVGRWRTASDLIASPRHIPGMDETKIEKLARLSGRVASRVAGALERRGYDIRGKISAPISRVPRRAPVPKPKSND